MQRTVSPAAWSALAGLSLLTACSESHQPAAPLVEGTEFSAEDKRAAAALSISNNQTVSDATSAYARALLCNAGIETLTERFQQARGPMMDAQRKALEQARGYFGQQLRLLAEREGKSEMELNRDMEEATRQHPDPAENAQMAIACLRRLQQAV